MCRSSTACQERSRKNHPVKRGEVLERISLSSCIFAFWGGYFQLVTDPVFTLYPKRKLNRTCSCPNFRPTRLLSIKAPATSPSFSFPVKFNLWVNFHPIGYEPRTTRKECRGSALAAPAQRRFGLPRPEELEDENEDLSEDVIPETDSDGGSAFGSDEDSDPDWGQGGRRRARSREARLLAKLRAQNCVSQSTVNAALERIPLLRERDFDAWLVALADALHGAAMYPLFCVTAVQRDSEASPRTWQSAPSLDRGCWVQRGRPSDGRLALRQRRMGAP